jgi:hypothetical protein
MIPSVQVIKKHVAKSFGIPRTSMESSQRHRVVARPRQIAMFMAATMTHHSYPEIGRMFGGRDHTTVMHAVRKIEELMSIDVEFSDRVKEVKATIFAPPEIGIDDSVDNLDEAARQVCRAAVRRAKVEMGASVSGKPETLRQTLLEAYGERVAITGMTRDGHSVELLVSRKGTWSMIEVAADGEVARMVVSGFEWRTPAPQESPAVLPTPDVQPAPDAPPAYPRDDNCMRCRKTFKRTSVGHRHCADCRSFLSENDSNLES